MILSGVIRTNCICPLTTRSIASVSLCDSPTKSVITPCKVNLLFWSIIRDASGLTHTTILPDTPTALNIIIIPEVITSLPFKLSKTRGKIQDFP